MRRPTLLEKRYGPGIRPGLLETVRAPDMTRCFAERGDHPCPDPVAGSAELYVDETPPAIDAYSKILARLPVRKWSRVPFCLGHLEDVMRRSVEDQVSEQMWAPGGSNPAVLPRPPRLLTG